MANILIVDDSPTNRSLLVTLLGYGGHSLREAADGAEALALVSSERPDLVITDILMPTMDGYEFVRRLRSMSEIAHTPVIFCTAHFREYDAKDLARQCGVEHVLVKPCDPDTVVRAVEACLNKIGPAPAPPVAEDFDREHLRLLMDKLTEQSDKLTISNLRLEALIEITLQLATESEPGRLIEEFCKSARQLISAKFALAGIVHEGGQAPASLALAGVDWESYPSFKKTQEPHTAVTRIIKGGPARVSNPGGDPAALGFPPDYPSFDSILAAPIVSPSRTFGWLCLFHRLGAVEFTEEEERLAGILGALAGRIYENGSLYAIAQRHGVELEQELSERQRAEAALEERRRVATFGAEIGIALTKAVTTREGLQQSAEAFVRYMDVAFARIWTLNEKTNELDLEASAGMYTHLDGTHGRVPVGRFKIGRIAQRNASHVNNDVPNDPEVSDPEWAKREGMVAFAGYPLSVEGRVVGVVAAFGRHPFGDPIVQAFASVSIQLAQFITWKRAEAETRDAVERLNLALKASRTGIWTWDAVNDRIVWDENTYELFGVRPGNFGGKFQDFAAFIHPDDREAALVAVRECTPEEPEYAAEFRVIWPDGVMHHLDARGRAFYDDADRLIRMTGLSHDITEQRQLEGQFRQAQKMEAIGQLAGGIAHDFNNVLNVIIGYAKLMLASSTPQDPAYRRVEEIRKAGERAATLTQQLLAFSRKQVLQPRVLNLGDTLRDTDHMVRRIIGEDIEILTTVDEDLAQVKIDPSQVQQVLLNLVVNARDAMPEGGKLTLELMNKEVDESSGRAHGIPSGKYVMLSVSDSGTGMTPEIKRHVFEPFFTTKEVGQGTGLGLATVYGIVQQSGGYIWLYSEPGIGTTFKIFFPRVDEPMESPSGEPLRKMVRGNETILVVEDDPSLRALAQEVLSSVGYDILVAEDGNQALRASEQYPGLIQLLLTDVVLPKMSGKEVATRLTAVRPEMKVLFMSGYTGNALSQQGTLDQAVDFIQKPWTPEGLCEKIRGVLTTPPSIQRILVVDDEPGIRNWLTEVLEGAGYQVLTARDGRQARAEAAKHPVDLMITDLVMPDEEGLETIRAMRKEYPELKIIAMSGAVGPTFLKAAEYLGAQKSLAKPLSAEIVLQCIRDLS